MTRPANDYQTEYKAVIGYDPDTHHTMVTIEAGEEEDREWLARWWARVYMDAEPPVLDRPDPNSDELIERLVAALEQTWPTQIIYTPPPDPPDPPEHQHQWVLAEFGRRFRGNGQYATWACPPPCGAIKDTGAPRSSS